MPLLSRLESRFGLTRGDVTITLFLASTALFGFIYTTFFDQRTPSAERPEMLQLRMRHDSIIAAQRSLRLATMSPEVTSPGSTDTVAAWSPLTAEDKAIDDAVDRASNPSAGGGRKVIPAGPVDLNTASRETLMQLPGVGEKTAEMIIERRKHVPFRRVEDIMEVKGIGEKKFEKLKPHIRVK